LLSNIHEFQVLVERYEDDPGLCSKVLRAHALGEPASFVNYSQTCLLELPVSRAVKFIAGLALTAGMIPALAELCHRDRKNAILIAKKLMQCEPRFDTALADYLLRPTTGAEPEEGQFYGVLDLLEAVSEGDKLVPQALKLLRHNNPKIRSKAALFIGSRTQNLTWAASRSQEFDGRVRANILESLSGLNSELVHQLFGNHIGDENNRCRGNALLGLYQLGDAAAIPLVYEMARHPEARFRNTCAWLMGRTGDPRFLPVLAEMIKDGDEIVRSQAFKGMGAIKRSLRAGSSRPLLKVAVPRMQMGASRTTLIATVHDPAGQPVRGLPGTSFITKAGVPARLVRDFSVEEYDCRSILNVGFVICLPEHNEAGAEQRYLEIVEGCVPLRRSKDRWGLVKIRKRSGPRRSGPDAKDSGSRYRQRLILLNMSGEDAEASRATLFDPKFEFSALQQRFTGMAGDHTLQLAEGAEEEEARMLVDQLVRVDIASSKPSLMFIGSTPPPAVLEEILSRRDLAVLYFLSDEEGPNAASLREQAERTGGAYRCASEKGLGDLCRTLCSSLLHHYKVASGEICEPMEVEINSSVGRGNSNPGCLSEGNQAAVNSGSPAAAPPLEAASSVLSV
jgi:hypothetical protein